MAKPSVLLICTANCYRSQMAEGLLRGLAGPHLEIHSAGTWPAGYVHSSVKEALAEIGLDVKGQYSKGLHDLQAGFFDYVITLCGSARESCRDLLGRLATLHWPIEDLSSEAGGPEAYLNPARRVRDELRRRLTVWLREIGIDPVPLPGDAGIQR